MSKYCLDCNKPISSRAIRCKDCYKKFNFGKNTPRYKDGRTLKPNYCPVCGKLLKSYISNRCKRCTSKGERNPKWKGGRLTSDGGYIYIYKPEHPNCNNSGYVPEHHLVMEQKLGRYLTNNEFVHHKNGIRDDNRIENLELWTKIHPIGVRVEEMINWSIDFLKKYDYEVNKK